MKRSRRVVLTLMGSAAIGAVSMGLVPRTGLRPGQHRTSPALTAGPIAARPMAASAARRADCTAMAMVTAAMRHGGGWFAPVPLRRTLDISMQRIVCPERDDWRATAESAGFDFHTIDGERYWDERAYYAFTLDEIERGIEAPTGEIDAMCLELVGRAIDDESYLRRLKIPEAFWPLISESWHRDDGSLYGRLDLQFRRPRSGEAAGIQRGHPDLDLRGGGVPVDLARTGDRAATSFRSAPISSIRSTSG